MFEVPPHVSLSECVLALVLVAASAGVTVRSAGAYPRELYAGLVAVLLAANAALVWAALRNHSIRRQRTLGPDSLSQFRE